MQKTEPMPTSLPDAGARILALEEVVGELEAAVDELEVAMVEFGARILAFEEGDEQ